MLKKILLLSSLLLLPSLSYAQVVIVPSRSTSGGGGGSGDVVGPSSATDGNAACFDGVTGKLIKECGAGSSGHYVVTQDDSLPNQFNLGGLTSGVLKITVSGSVATPSVVTAQNCTNQFIRGISAIYSATCASVVNADVGAGAAIAYSKLNLATSIVNADINGSAAIAYSKLNLTGNILAADLAGSIPASKLVLTDISTVGTITTGQWNASIVPVAFGGTGISTATIHGVVIGQTTSAFHVTSAGSAGQCLISNGSSSDPTFQSCGSGSGDFVGPGSSTNNNLVAFDGTTGKLGKDSGIGIADIIAFSATPVQGDIFYSDGTNIVPLNKSATATRYLSNTGTSNNPAWALINLPDGVTGNLAIGNIVTSTNRDATHFLRGDGSWQAISATGCVTTGTAIQKGDNAGGCANATAGTEYSSPSSTDILLNKTYNVESTGNVFEQPIYVALGVAVSQAGTASLGFNTPSSGAATVTSNGTTVISAHPSFADSETEEVQFHVPLLDWDSSASVEIIGKWRTTATSGNVVWQVQGVCLADAEVVPTAYSSTADTVTDAAKGTTLQANDFSLTLSTLSNHSLATCASGEELYLRFFRDPTNGSDTIAAAAELISMSIRYRQVK